MTEDNKRFVLEATLPGKETPLEQDAKAATNDEKTMSVQQALRLYPKAAAWSILFSSAVAMEGYDIVLIASFFAFPPFNQKFGHPVPGKEGKYGVSASWQSGLSNGARVGEILGLTLNGIVAEKYGARKTMIFALLAMVAFIFIPFFAQNIETLQVAAILLGKCAGVLREWTCLVLVSTTCRAWTPTILS